MRWFNRCNMDEYFQTNRDRPPALNPSGISLVDSYRGDNSEVYSHIRTRISDKEWKDRGEDLGAYDRLSHAFTSRDGNQLSKHTRRDMFNGGNINTVSRGMENAVWVLVILNSWF